MNRKQRIHSTKYFNLQVFWIRLGAPVCGKGGNALTLGASACARSKRSVRPPTNGLQPFFRTGERTQTATTFFMQREVAVRAADMKVFIPGGKQESHENGTIKSTLSHSQQEPRVLRCHPASPMKKKKQQHW